MHKEARNEFSVANELSEAISECANAEEETATSPSTVLAKQAQEEAGLDSSFTSNAAVYNKHAQMYWYPLKVISEAKKARFVFFESSCMWRKALEAILEEQGLSS